jgi:hypothetical protein
MEEENTVINTTPENANETVKVDANGDGLTEKIKNFIKINYLPTQDASQATMRLTSTEIYANIQRIYPGIPFTEMELSQFLHELGFTFWDAGGMRLEWLLSPAD